MSKPDVIIHPTRLRIIQAFAAGKRLTAQQLAHVLPDIAHASLYRHLNVLVEAGVLAVVEERPVRAIQERVYALKERAANVGPGDIARSSADEHLRYFTTFLALLRGDFERYLRQAVPVDVAADGVAYYQLPLYLSDSEYADLIASLRAVLQPVVAQQPSPGRRRRLLSIVAMPGIEGISDQLPTDPSPQSPDGSDVAPAEPS
ncbi:MAG TPA: helix-turn-helix domain-containing protein [Ktedonobacterales bacterium]|nr:helix-turn-helix domain-containing protein [Ktedonobacterales bacterium]